MLRTILLGIVLLPVAQVFVVGEAKADCPDWQTINSSTQAETWKTCNNCCNITPSCLGDIVTYQTTVVEREVCSNQVRNSSYEYTECVNTHCL